MVLINVGGRRRGGSHGGSMGYFLVGLSLDSYPLLPPTQMSEFQVQIPTVPQGSAILISGPNTPLSSDVSPYPSPHSSRKPLLYILRMRDEIMKAFIEEAAYKLSLEG